MIRAIAIARSPLSMIGRLWDRWIIAKRIQWAEDEISGLEWQREVDERRVALLHKYLAELRVQQAVIK